MRLSTAIHEFNLAVKAFNVMKNLHPFSSYHKNAAKPGFQTQVEVLEMDEPYAGKHIVFNKKELLSIVKRFAPILHFHHDDDYELLTVESYLTNSQLANDLSKNKSNVDPGCFPPKEAFQDGTYLQTKASVQKSKSFTKVNPKAYVHVKDQLNGYIDLQYWFLFSGKGSSAANIKWMVEGITGHNGKINLSPIGCRGGHWDRITVRLHSDTLSMHQIYLPNSNGGEWMAPERLQLKEDQANIFISKNNHFFYPGKGVKLIEFLKFQVLSSTLEFSFYDECSSAYHLDFSDAFQIISYSDFDIEPNWLSYPGKWANPSFQNLNVNHVNKVLRDAFGKDLSFLLGNNVSEKLSSFLINYYNQECKCKAYGPKRMKCWTGPEEGSAL